MKNVFEYVKGDSVIEIKGDYSCDVVDGKLHKTAKFVLCLNGKKIKETNSHWYLKAEYSKHTNAYMVHNLKFGFADEKAADDYNIWLDQLFENGTTDEAKEFIKVEEAREVRERIERAKKTVEKAEKQGYLPLNKDMRAYIRNYNNICNEGGEGFVPIFVSKEEYEEAKQLVAEYENTSARA